MQLPKPSSLLLKRLAPKHGSKKNLTILTPPYIEESNHGVIQSAPLKRTTLVTANRVLKRTQKAATPTVTTTMSQKQKFLQPFEFLYDQIEQTKQLKTTLDDQIRRSSSLIQTLQQPNYVESVVRRQVRDDSVTRRLEDRLLDCVERVTRLEERLASGNKLDDTISQLSDRIQQLEAKLASSSQ
ncbi:MAG: hypothetical protein EXX96DRAFT_487193 [Benjaminiella poitrasii]|nr:MAG: hypothetical protein EXX96DRAFT_487193 [Benjaminiella poitrasii]